MKPLLTTLTAFVLGACTIPNPDFLVSGRGSGGGQVSGAGGHAGVGGGGVGGAGAGAAGAGGTTAPGSMGGAGGSEPDAGATGADGNADSATPAPRTYFEVVRSTPGLVGYWRMGVEPSVVDDFGGPAGTTLQSRTVNGHTWTSFTAEGAGSQNAVFTAEGRLRKDGAGNRAHYHSSWVPSSPDYAIEADLHVKTVIDDVSLIVRQNLASNNGLDWYAARYFSGGWEIRRVINNVAATIGSATPPLLAKNTTARLRLEIGGSNPAIIRVFLNNALIVTASDTNVNRITVPGRAGLRFGAVSSTDAITDATGMHLDNLRVVPSTSGGGALVDSTGMNNGTYTGTPSLNVVGALVGDNNGATRFSASGDFASVPDSPSLDLGNGPFTLEAWVRRNDSATGLRTIMQKGIGAYQFAFSDNKVGLYRYTGAEERRMVIESMPIMAGGAYHHYVVTRNGSAVTLFVDGVSAVGAVGSQTLLDNTSPLVLGGTADFLSADLDELAIYKVVLDSTAIMEHFRLGSGR